MHLKPPMIEEKALIWLRLFHAGYARFLSQKMSKDSFALAPSKCLAIWAPDALLALQRQC